MVTTTSSGQSPDATMDRKAYEAFLTELNRKVEGDPKITGKAFVIRPPSDDTPTAYAEFDQRLRLAAEANILHQRGLSADKMQEAVEDLSRHIRGMITGEGYKEGFSKTNSQSKDDDGNLADASYLGASVALRPTRTFAQTWGAEAGGHVSEAFQKSVSIEFIQKQAIAHELGHGLYAAHSEKGDAQNTFPLRNEMTADAFSVLYLIQNKEPEMEKQLGSIIALRDGSLAIHDKGTTHDTSPVLRQILADMPKLKADPEFQKKSLADLMQMADGYSHVALHKAFPHLNQANDLSDYEVFSKTDGMQRKYEAIQEYAYKKLHGEEWKDKTYAHVDMEKLDTNQAALLLRISEGYEKVSGNRDNPLSRDVARLRAGQPETFRDADRILGEDRQSVPQDKLTSLKGVKEASELFTSIAGKQSGLNVDSAPISLSTTSSVVFTAASQSNVRT